MFESSVQNTDFITMQKRATYDYMRAESLTAEPAPATRHDESGPPTTWASPSASDPSVQTWYEWVFGAQPGPAPSTSGPQRPPPRPQQQRFVYDTYAASPQGSGRGPGISAKDIIDLFESLPQSMSWTDDDHGDTVSARIPP